MTSATYWCQSLSIRFKLTLYKTLLRSILLYGCETWSGPQTTLTKLAMLEIRLIYEPIFNPQLGRYSKRSSADIYARYDEPDIKFVVRINLGI